jgi:2-oxo-3-hexenedioate decarboxylase
VYDDSEVARIAELLDQAARTRTPTVQLAACGHELDLTQAYAVQRALIRRREQRGERLAGVKMGFTSNAKRVQMGIDDLIWGQLTDAMQVGNGGQLSMASFIHPRVEPEIAFRLQQPLRGVVSAQQARAAVGGVAVALEILDSRYRDFRFSLPDVIADNSSSAAFVCGPWCAPPPDLSQLAIVMSFEGRAVQRGSSADVMGDPLLSLLAAARLAGEAGMTLEPGWVVMSGGATAAEPLAANTRVTATVAALGEVSLEVKA